MASTKMEKEKSKLSDTGRAKLRRSRAPEKCLNCDSKTETPITIPTASITSNSEDGDIKSETESGSKSEVSVKTVDETPSHSAPEDTNCSKIETATVASTTDHNAPEPKVENTYKMLPDARFEVKKVERLVRGVLVENLKTTNYDPMTCKLISQDLAAVIMERLKILHIKRFKLVTVVSIGSLNDKPGMQFGSRCLWNEKTDSFASVKFTNGSLFAVAMVYALYFE